MTTAPSSRAHNRFILRDSAIFALQPLERRVLLCTLEGVHLEDFHGPETGETEPNDLPELATPFGPTDTLVGSISSSSDVDYFVTTLTQGDRLRVRPGTDPGQRHYKPLLEIVGNSGAVLMRSGDGHEINFHPPASGDYYVRLSAPSDYGTFTGSYGTSGGSNPVSVTVSPFLGTTEVEPNDVLAAATPIGSTTNFRGSLDSIGDVDAFSFTVTSNTAVSFKFTGIPQANPSLRLYDSAGTLIAEQTNGSGLARTLSAAGTYRIAIGSDNSAGAVTGGYVGTFNRAGGTMVLEADDIANNSFEGAIALPISTATSRGIGMLDASGDIDFYTMNFIAGRWYSFTLESNTDNMMRSGRQLMLFNEFGQAMEVSYTGTMATNAATGFGFRIERSGKHYVGVRTIDALGSGGYVLTAQQTQTFPTQRDVPLIFHDYTGQRTHLGYGPPAPLTRPETIPAFIGMFEARYDVYDVDVTTTYPGAGTAFVGFGAGEYGSIGAYGYGGSFNIGTRRATGDSLLDDSGTNFTSLANIRNPASVMNQEIGHGAGLYAHARNPQAFMAYDSQSAMNVIGTYFPFPWTDSRVPDVESRNEREFQDWVLQAGRIAEEIEPNNTLTSPQDLNAFLSAMTSDGTPRNDRVALSGRIDGPDDVDVYSLTVTAGATFAFDIDSAEFQHSLDATLRIFDSSGKPIAASFEAFDRESGLSSVDPYLVHTFAAPGTYKIQITGENETFGNYRLKVTSAAAFDAAGPRVIASWPNGGTSQDSTRQLMFWINGKLDSQTLTSQNIIVQGTSSGVRSGQAVFDPTDNALIWLADEPLPIDSYTVNFKSGADGIRDLRGNQLDGETDGTMTFPEVSGDGGAGGDFVTTFTINANDTTPAAVSSSSIRRHPYNRLLFSVTFNDELDVQRIYASNLALRGAGGDNAYGTADDYFVPIDLNYDKIKSTTSRVLEVYTRGVPDFGNYRLEGSMLDAAGNTVVVSRSFSFTTSTTPLTSGPSIVSSSVRHGSPVASPTNSIDVRFSAKLNLATLTADSFVLRYSPDGTFFDGNDTFVADADGVIEWDATMLTARFQAAANFANGYYLLELDGDAGGIAAPSGKLIDGEWLDTHIAGNELFSHWQDTPSGDGFAGGDWRAMFVVPGVDTIAPVIEQGTFVYQTAPHKLIFNASEDIGASLSESDVILDNLTTGMTVPSSSMQILFDITTNTATLTFPRLAGSILPDGSYRATLLAAGITDPAGNPLAADFVFEFFFLSGDANHDGNVNLADFNILAANFGQSPRDFTQGDFNYDGQVNLTDFNILAVRFGATLGPNGTLRRTGGMAPVLAQLHFGSGYSPTTRFSGERVGDDDRLEQLA